jgi:hypothetical protein
MNDLKDSAGLTLEDLLVKHLVPRLEVTKTLCFTYGGQILEKREVPDHDNQLERQYAIYIMSVRCYRGDVHIVKYPAPSDAGVVF